MLPSFAVILKQPRLALTRELSGALRQAQAALLASDLSNFKPHSFATAIELGS
jgi:hypothetical protein